MHSGISEQMRTLLLAAQFSISSAGRGDRPALYVGWNRKLPKCLNSL